MSLSGLWRHVVYPVLWLIGSSLADVVLGMVLTWVDRLVSARVQWRKGPPFIQPFADLFKLLLKQTVVPEHAARTPFLLAPVVGLAGTALALLVLLNASFGTGGFAGDIIVLVYLLALPPLGLIVGASASRNPIAAVGASREMTLYFGYELPFLLALLVPVVKVVGVPGARLSQALRLSELVAFQSGHGPFLYAASGVIAGLLVLAVIQAKLGYVPFDMAEAEQEIMSGVLVEYSGASLALFRLSKAMLLVVLPLLFVTVFWGGIRDWWAIPKVLAIVVLVILAKNTNPRMRVDQALRFFWFILGGLGIIGVALAFAKL